jgi:Family of unknown function (DUF5996)
MAQADPLWPPLPLDAWQDTYLTLHLWTQIVGKIRMTMSPPLNHWWHTTFYVNARGLTTSPIPFRDGVFEIQFNFVDHQLEIFTSGGGRRALPLGPIAVAEFYATLMHTLRAMGIEVAIHTKPQEMALTTPFEEDHQHASYDGEYVRRFFQVLVSTRNAMQEFRGRFIGKSSPVQFFWGSFDLACTRFSGLPAAPPRKGAITGPAYSHDEISAGFWPGAGFDGPAFYSYTAPAPAGLELEPVRPAVAGWNRKLGEFILMYDDVRVSASPHDTLMEFLQSTYEAGARLAKWDRAVLEADGAAQGGSR